MGYSTVVEELPVENVDGPVLISFERLREEGLCRLDPSVRLTGSLVVLWCAGKCLIVFNRSRQAWELPGGMLDPGESPREAAIRELDEESGQRPDTLDFAGVAQTRGAPDHRPAFLAIYRGQIASPLTFTPNDEISECAWWDPRGDLAGLFPGAAALARLCQQGQA